MTAENDNSTPPKKRYRSALNSVSRIRKELSKLYRESRSGALPLTDLTKYTFTLTALSRMIVDEELEARIEDLERVNPGALPDRRAPYESTQATQVPSEAPTDQSDGISAETGEDDPSSRRH